MMWLVILGPWKSALKTTNNKTQTNRFLLEILKIIFKNLKWVLLLVFQKLYFYFNLTVKFWLNNLSVYYDIIGGRFNDTTSDQIELCARICVCVCV